MAIAKPITIARFTLFDDTIATITDKILFNNPIAGDFKNNEKVGAYFTSFKVVQPEGLGVNQAAEKPDGNIQSLGVTEKTYVLTGFVTKTDGNDNLGDSNAVLLLLDEWKTDPNILKGVWEAGRFAISDSNDSTNTLIRSGPSALGLLFKGYVKDYDPNKNRTNIVLTFRRSTGPDI